MLALAVKARGAEWANRSLPRIFWVREEVVARLVALPGEEEAP